MLNVLIEVLALLNPFVSEELANGGVSALDKAPAGVSLRAGSVEAEPCLDIGFKDHRTNSVAGFRGRLYSLCRDTLCQSEHSHF